MAFPYNNAIPQGTDIPAQSQPLMLQNFASIDLELQVDHVSFAGGPAGAHNKVSFVTQPTPPPAIVWPAGVNFGMYATAAGIFTHTVYGAVTTEANITSKANFAAPGQWNFLQMIFPSGVVIYSGTAISGAAGLITVDMPLLPQGTTIYASCNPIDNGAPLPLFAAHVVSYVNDIAHNRSRLTAYVTNYAGTAAAPAGTYVYFQAIGY